MTHKLQDIQYDEEIPGWPTDNNWLVWAFQCMMYIRVETLPLNAHAKNKLDTALYRYKNEPESVKPEIPPSPLNDNPVVQAYGAETGFSQYQQSQPQQQHTFPQPNPYQPPTTFQNTHFEPNPTQNYQFPYQYPIHQDSYSTQPQPTPPSLSLQQASNWVNSIPNNPTPTITQYQQQEYNPNSQQNYPSYPIQYDTHTGISGLATNTTIGTTPIRPQSSHTTTHQEVPRTRQMQEATMVTIVNKLTQAINILQQVVSTVNNHYPSS